MNKTAARNLDKARMISNQREGDYAFFYAPGWHTNGEIIAKNFDRHVEQLGSTHYGVHPIGTYSIDLQKEAWIDARKEDGYRPAKIYAQSKGALTVSHMLDDPGFRYEFGEIDSICFDSPVSSRHDISPLFYAFMNFGRRLPNRPAVEKLCRKAMELMLSKEPDFDKAAKVTLAEARENAAASTQTRLIACISQLEYMWTQDVADFDLHEAGASIRNKKIISAPYDSLVNIERSAAVIDRSYGGGFVHWVDTRRRHGDHATGTERPRGVVDALTDRNAGDYRAKSIGATALSGMQRVR